MLFRVSVVNEIKKEYDEAYAKVLESERECLLDFTNLREKIKAIVDHKDFRSGLLDFGCIENSEVHAKVCAYLDEQYQNIESTKDTKVIPTVKWLVLTSSLYRHKNSYWLFPGCDDNSHCVRGIEHKYFLFTNERLVVFYPIIDGKITSFNHSEIRNLINNHRVGFPNSLFFSKAISTYNYAKSISNKLASRDIRRSIVIHSRWTELYIPDRDSDEECSEYKRDNNIHVRVPSNDILSEKFDEYDIVIF